MSKRRDPNPEFDLFIPALGDLPLKDQREVMERPFFSLQKRKRLKPIEYRSPDGEAWVRVQAIPDYGMATIWDADILIWAASTLNRMKQQGVNDLPRTLTTTPYDLLRAIKRSTGGRDYQELQAALLRLQTTSITTSIRATKRRQKAGFNWLARVLSGGAASVTNGLSLRYHLTITSQEAAAGTQKRVAFMRGDQLEELMVTIPPGIRSGTRLRLQGKGLDGKAGARGDLYLRVTVT